jgi:hypothetical protein
MLTTLEGKFAGAGPAGRCPPHPLVSVAVPTQVPTVGVVKRADVSPVTLTIEIAGRIGIDLKVCEKGRRGMAAADHDEGNETTGGGLDNS